MHPVRIFRHISTTAPTQWNALSKPANMARIVHLHSSAPSAMRRGAHPPSNGVGMAGIKDVAARAGVSISTVSYVVSGKRAARAGVSISTVSYVVSGKRKIGAATQARVRAAALELGYRPVVDATEPASARGTHVLAVSSPLRPYTDVSTYAAFFFALAAAAKRHGYGILLLTHEAGDQELRRVADRGMADGVFLLARLRHPAADARGRRSGTAPCGRSWHGGRRLPARRAAQ